MRTMTTAIALLSLALPALAGPFGKRPLPKPAVSKAAAKGKPPIFEAEGYKLALDEMEARAKVELAEGGEREYSVRFQGRAAAPREEDAVAITKEPKVLAILDAQKRSILQLKGVSAFRGFGTGGKKQLSTYKPNTYAFFHDRRADVEVPLTKLIQDAYTIDTLELEATAIIAEQREGKTLPAIVMEQPVEIVKDLPLRVMTLKLSAKGEMTVVVEYTRPQAGPGGPFVEQVAVLDENDGTLSAARWRQGDPFGSAGTLTAELAVPEGKVHKSLRFTACTKYTLKPMKFVVRDIVKK